MRRAQARADGLGCVFDKSQLMALRKLLERVHLSGDAEGVDCKDGAGARRDCALHRVRVQVKREGIDLNEDRHGAHLKYGVNNGHESERGDDDLMALADSKREQREMKTCGAGTDSYCVVDAMIGSQLRFKSCEFRTQAEVRSPQNRANGGDLSFSDVGRGEWNARGHCLSARADSAHEGSGTGCLISRLSNGTEDSTAAIISAATPSP